MTLEEAEIFLEGYTQEGAEIGSDYNIVDCLSPLDYGDVGEFLSAYTQGGEEVDASFSVWGECEGSAPQALVDAGWWTEDVDMWEAEGRRVLERQDEGDEEVPLWVFDDMG